MKCWECKNEINLSNRVHYLYIGRDGEVFSSSVRDVCPKCYKLLKFDPCHFVRVFTPRGRGLIIKTSIKRQCKDCKGVGYEQGSGGLCSNCKGTGRH